MKGLPETSREQPSQIAAISSIAELSPSAQVQRYAWAVHNYLVAFLRKKQVKEPEDAAGDVLTRVMVKFLEGRLSGWKGEGKFRFFVKAVVRNAAIDYLRGLGRTDIPLESLPEVGQEDAPPGQDDWTPLYQRDIFQNALKALEAYQKAHQGNVFYTVMRFLIEQAPAALAGEEPPEAEETLMQQLADRLTRETGKEYSRGNVRQQKARARHKFADFLVSEVKLTLEQPTAGRVEEELAELGLLRHVRALLGTAPA